MLYFIISMIALMMVLFQNLGNTNSYNVGTFSCRVPNTAVIFIVKFIYVLFWTYVLNLICKDGGKDGPTFNNSNDKKKEDNYYYFHNTCYGNGCQKHS